MKTWIIKAGRFRYVLGYGTSIATSATKLNAKRFTCSRAEILFTIKGLEEISQAYRFEPEEICT
jgi:hypothetical protein